MSCTGSWSWGEVPARLRAAGHEVVAPDLDLSAGQTPETHAAAVAPLIASEVVVENLHILGRTRPPAQVIVLSARARLELVAQRDPVVADRRDLGLQRRPALVDRARVQRGEAEPAALVEAQRVDVVVGGDQPQARAARRDGGVPHRREERGARAAPRPAGVQGEHLALQPGIT